MKSYRTTMIASVAAFALAGAGIAVALSGQPVIAGADGTTCVPSTSTSVSATGHHGTIGTDHSGASASAGTSQGTTGSGTTSSSAGNSAAVSSGASGASATSPSLITVNTGANGTTSAGMPATSSGSVINVNTNTGQRGTSGLIKTVVGAVTTATHRGTGNVASGATGRLLGSSGLFGNGLLGGLTINGNVNANSSASNS